MKVKDQTNACCMAINAVVGECKVDIETALRERTTIEGFQSLTHKGYPAGKVHLTIKPAHVI